MYEVTNKEEVRRIVEQMTLFDDDLMSRVFDKNIPATELLLRIILNKNLNVISVIGQNEMKNPVVGGRNIRLDVHAEDENGQQIDIEVQTDPAGAHEKRARYYSSVMDSRMLKEKQDFKELKDSYVIFIYKHDKFKQGLPLYHIERYVEENGKVFGDGSHIIYVNGKYKGEDALGQLVADFNQNDPEKMHYKELADGVTQFRKTEGDGNMSEIVEKYARTVANRAVKRAVKQATNDTNVNSVKSLMKNANFTLDQSLNMLEIKGDDRKFVIEQLKG